LTEEKLTETEEYSNRTFERTKADAGGPKFRVVLVTTDEGPATVRCPGRNVSGSCPHMGHYKGVATCGLNIDSNAGVVRCGHTPIPSN
jgi:hypothetical protein